MYFCKYVGILLDYMDDLLFTTFIIYINFIMACLPSDIDHIYSMLHTLLDVRLVTIICIGIAIEVQQLTLHLNVYLFVSYTYFDHVR